MTTVARPEVHTAQHTLGMYTEAEFLDVIGSFPPCYSQSPLLTDFTPFFPSRKSGLKLVCNINIVYENLKPKNSQDYAQKSQRNCTFMNSASVQCKYIRTRNSFISIIANLHYTSRNLDPTCLYVLFHLQPFPTKSRAALVLNTFSIVDQITSNCHGFLTSMETELRLCADLPSSLAYALYWAQFNWRIFQLVAINTISCVKVTFTGCDSITVVLSRCNY
jgi:hypothetical protein